MFGLGPVPWPFVRRSRFVRELTTQGEAYRQNVAVAEMLEARARRELNEKTKLFADSVTKLSGWREKDGTYVQFDTPDGEVQHFRMRTARDIRGRRTTFVCDVSDEMLNRLRQDSTTAGIVLRSVTEALVYEAIMELAERGWEWQLG